MNSMRSRKVTDLENRKQLSFELFVHVMAIVVGTMIFMLPISKATAIFNMNMCFIVFSLYCFMLMTVENLVSKKNYIACGVWLLNFSLQALNLFFFLK